MLRVENWVAGRLVRMRLRARTRIGTSFSDAAAPRSSLCPFCRARMVFFRRRSYYLLDALNSQSLQHCLLILDGAHAPLRSLRVSSTFLRSSARISTFLSKI